MKFTPFFLEALPLLSVVAQERKKLFTFDEAFSSNFSVSRTTLQWVRADTDGTYIVTDPSTSSLIFSNIVTGENSSFVDATKLGFDYYDFAIQPSQENVLFSANRTKQYRYSFFADYYVFNRESAKVVPLVDNQAGDIAYAAWSPEGDVIAFVRGNDLYLWKGGAVTRVTNDGGPDIFNGVPDWVYEEEIYADRYTLWFSPDGEYIAFLSMNETDVPTYTVDYYMAGQTVAPQSPRKLKIRYPKVSEANPTVAFNILHVRSAIAGIPKVRCVEIDTFDDLIISEVAWTADKHEHVAFRAMNRVQDQEKLVLVDVESGSAKVVRERNGTDGWLDNNKAIKYVGEVGEAKYYLDLSDHTGWTHLYLYPVTGGAPKALTSGEWEVTSIVKFDASRNLVYFLSTEHHSTERHLYSVSLDTGKKTPLVDTSEAGCWSASFSASANYYILSYLGPDIPWQKLYSINSSTPIQTITTNSALEEQLTHYSLPTTRYTTLRHPAGYALNVREILPANFSPRKRYPVLFTPYGGPGSQEVIKTYSAPNWRTYLGSDPELEYILVTVDNRGTGYKGRAFRSAVSGQLGKLEAADQIWAAREWAKKPYVSCEHIAIWGWSYGGYLTAKVVEADSGAFSLGLITAPVSDWRFYDSVYTERYMKTYEQNAAGYNESAVRKVTGFKHISGSFLVQHGSGDDNVHFQNSAALVDLLTNAGVSPDKMEVRWFTDSDHSIKFHGATTFLYKQLTKKLYEEKNRGTGQKHQWSRRWS